MSNSFIYLFGAGASCQFLPLAKEFSDRLKDFVKKIDQIGTKNLYGEPVNDIKDSVFGEYREKFREDVIWLSENASRHATVDTFAKKLYFLEDKESLKRLKATLSSYLVIEQALYPVDKRYDSFFASILQKDVAGKVKLPPNIKILTWNYDTQIEKAFFGFCNNENNLFNEITKNKKIFPINGQCGKNPSDHYGNGFRAVWKNDVDFAWIEGIKLHHECLSDEHSSPVYINFAWKVSDLSDNVLEFGNDVREMIIIGYSFPYFNREVDINIFSYLQNLETIYLQFPDGEHKAIRERLLNIINLSKLSRKFVDISGTDLFYLPNGL